MKQNIILCGGLGFVGFHTAQKLQATKNYNVIIVDAERQYIKYLTKENPYKRRKNLLNNCTFYNLDCNDKELLSDVFIKHKPDFLIHFAALPIVWKAEQCQNIAQKDILNSFKSVLETLEENQIKTKKIIYISSSMVYGNFQRDTEDRLIPAVENQPTKPNDIYGKYKLLCEDELKRYAKNNAVNFNIIRPSAVYGPEDYNLRVVEIFISNAIQNKNIILSEDGSLKLDFTYVEDLAIGIIQCMELGKNNETYNLTLGKGYSIRELAQMVKNRFPNVEIVNGLLEAERKNRTFLDITKAKNDFGFNPKTDLESGLNSYIDYIISNSTYNE
ncbi:MAG: NAD-dependent epimerase/dehydratase family protein [Bacteroidales bacterium]|jgi:nucleoside-diphosphate-sugar epimerase